MTPIWAGGALLLVRKVAIEGVPMMQGCWLDLTAIRKQLLSTVAELLPHAQLNPARDSTVAERAHRLASLPLELIPGELPVSGSGALSPMQLALLAGWAAFALAAAAVGTLLWGVVSLSERRAAFVSAVTHELRTPLTTFRLYSEMLSEGMVPDEPSRRSYLQTLRTEADRLMHLVENVLAYARLERGRPRKRVVPTSVKSLIAHAEPRLRARGEQCGMTLSIEGEPNAMTSIGMADATAVEQILFNLVDNACKYAVQAPDKNLILGVQRAAGWIRIYLQDCGPGIPAKERGKLFRPFHKSAQDAATTAPGVGLGLALSRRLARAMGGDLLYQDLRGGACFTLQLELVEQGPEA
jgi:signal transduction histidine kinase